jgi:hypothetical protein
LIAFAAMFLVSVSFAQELACEGPYTNEILLTELDGIDDAFRSFDPKRARKLLSTTHRKLLCLDERADPLGLARLSRQLALTFFFDQDEDAMRRWSMMSRKLAPDLPWHADMGTDHPFRAQFSEFEIAEMAGPKKSLIPPKSGGVFWNGSYVDEPKAPMEMPALVQLVDKKGKWIAAWWQDGSAWPQHMLGEPGAVLKAPKWLTDPVSDPRHAENAARALFSEVAEVEVPEPAAEPLEPVYNAEEAAANSDDPTGGYRDPFEDARRRAIRRERYVSSTTNEAGDHVTINTEVVTFRTDRSGGKPITYEIFDYWSRNATEWAPGTHADSDYLRDWVDSRPPPNTSKKPLVWVSFEAAEAYCDSFGLGLPPVRSEVGDEPKWEWRLEGQQPVRVNARGKAVETGRTEVREDTGFRCQS